MRVRVTVFMLFITGIIFASSPFYGVQTHFGQFRRADMDSLSMELQLDLIREAGIEMIRDECLWSDVETDSGIYVIPYEVDRYVRSALNKDIDVYLILNYNNTIYAPSNGSGVSTQANRDAYARYCQAVVGHFSPLGVKHYEIWNEPNHGVLFWTPQPNAGDYAALLETAYDSIKAIDTSVTVIGCATSPAIGNPPPYIEGLDFIRDVFAAGGADHMDAVSFHLYQVAYRPEYELFSYVNSIRSYVGNMPIYFSEFGYPTHDGWPNISLEKQARYVTRMYLACASDPQIRSVIHYDLKNDGTVAEEPEHNFGLLQFDRSPKPAYTALKNLISKTDAQPPVLYSSENDIFNYKMSDSLYISWSYSGNKMNNFNANANYLRIENIFGDTLLYHITANDTIDLSISEDPVFCYVQENEPEISMLAFSNNDYLLYPDQSIEYYYTAMNDAGKAVMVDPSAINWIFIGDCGNIDQNSFYATQPGTGLIIAEIQGLTDTINLEVLEDPGYYIVEDFKDTSGFVLESSTLNMENSFLGIFSQDSIDNIELNYEYTGTSAIAYLHKDILINHYADSIFIDVFTDDKEYDFRLYCKDGNGVSYTLGLRPRPTSWNNTWGTLGGPVNIDENACPPVKIDKIYVKLKLGETAQVSPYSGKIRFSNLRLKKELEVNIDDEHQTPDYFNLSQNYPNPFNNSTYISFAIPTSSYTRLDIYDLRGNLLRSPINSILESGTHRVNVNFRDFPSGIYIYRLYHNNQSFSKKMVYLK